MITLLYLFVGFVNYFTACRKGLDAAASKASMKRLTLGGPAGLFRSRDKHPLCWGLANFCANNTQTSCLDFISFHKKGNESDEEILEQDLALVEEFRNRFPNLNDIPLVNE